MTVLPHRPGVVSRAALAGIILVGGLYVWNMGAGLSAEQDDQTRGEVLEADYDLLRHQFAAADAVGAQLAEGQLTLAGAVTELEDVTRDRRGFGQILEVVHPEAPTARARLARYAIVKAAKYLAAEPLRKAAVLDRLEAEYAALAAAG